ncbi:MAG: sulfatase-like hydrolase/transferase [Planctomycetaceae bacterium]|nr:sulfatase-like hydrolase/transferase [Planctomycetaceae bacterium]
MMRQLRRLRLILALILWEMVLATPYCLAARPNVIVIYSDDQGSIDANCYGATDLTTPSLDRLASSGVRFTQMYAPSAICSASRAGLLTGRFPVRAGVPGNVSSMKGHEGMPSSEVTMAEMFRVAGYATGHVGKWHLGYTPETMPNGQGFDESFGHMGGCIDNYSHYFYWNGPNRHDLWRNGQEIWRDGEFFPDLMVDECVNFIRQKRDRPFFLYWAINVPHYPMQGTAKWREHYADLEAPRRMYAEFVSTMDERVGKVLDAVEAAGLREQTLIVFQSDHGHSTEERAFFGGGNAGPYRGAKGCLFEGGIRVPSIVSFPGVIPQDEVRDQLAVGCDWFPTLADFCEIEVPHHQIDGRSIREVILKEDAPSPHKSFYWHLGGGENPQWVVREGDWKLLGNPQDRSNTAELTDADQLFLVNLSADIGERTNVASQYPETVQRLQQLRRNYLDDISVE